MVSWISLTSCYAYLDRCDLPEKGTMFFLSDPPLWMNIHQWPGKDNYFQQFICSSIHMRQSCLWSFKFLEWKWRIWHGEVCQGPFQLLSCVFWLNFIFVDPATLEHVLWILYFSRVPWPVNRYDGLGSELSWKNTFIFLLTSLPMERVSFKMLNLESQNLQFWWSLVLLVRSVWPLCLWVYKHCNISLFLPLYSVKPVCSQLQGTEGLPSSAFLPNAMKDVSAVALSPRNRQERGISLFRERKHAESG